MSMLWIPSRCVGLFYPLKYKQVITIDLCTWDTRIKLKDKKVYNALY